MSKEQMKKRYVVTYADTNITAAQAADVLKINLLDAVDILSTDAQMTDDLAVHFEGLGSSSLVMSDTQCYEIQKDERVLAIEEDIEFFAIDEYAPAANGKTTYVHEEDAEMDALAQQLEEAYSNGYQQGVNEVYEQIQTLFKNKMGDSLPPSFPFPRPDFPIPPIRPILQPTPWNINLVKAPAAWARGIRGNGVKVAVLDTGIATHPDLIISGGVSFIPGVVSFNDGNGHGTHCAGIIGARNNMVGVVGVAPSCSLYAVKVLADGGSGSLSGILAGMAWCRTNGMQVASMSLGAVACVNVAFTTAIAQLNAAGVTVVCASGNSGGTGFPFVNLPANSAGAIAVGAVNSAKAIAGFSSRGNCTPTANPVTIVAPGVSVNSTYLGGTYRSLSGTSMACPHVAGAVALIKQKFPFFTPAQIAAKIRATGADLGVPGADSTYGWGLLNCDAATL